MAVLWIEPKRCKSLNDVLADFFSSDALTGDIFNRSFYGFAFFQVPHYNCKLLPTGDVSNLVSLNGV